MKQADYIPVRTALPNRNPQSIEEAHSRRRTLEEWTDAYYEGYKARVTRVSESITTPNPYNVDHKREGWAHGWKAADRDKKGSK